MAHQQRYTDDLPGSGSTPRASSPNNNVRGPQPGFSRRNPTTKASTSAGIWCGHEPGLGDESANPARPLDAYRLSHRCTVWRVTPNRNATSDTDAPSRNTSNTAACLCSTTPSSTNTTTPSHVTTRPPQVKKAQHHQMRTIAV